MNRIDGLSFLAHLPHQPGVYQMVDALGKILYVGKAKDLKQRLTSYFGTHPALSKTAALIKQTHHITTTVTQSENEALLLECNLIKQFLPRYNILLRDDKSYPYIAITDNVFPRIEFYRGLRKKNVRYFGPYVHATLARDTIHFIQKTFRLRTCRDSIYKTRT